MIVYIIAAMAKNRVIGKDNDLVWNYPKDMRFFKDKTRGHFVIMGRKNFESIPEKYSPLPNRTNVVVTRQENFVAKGCLVVKSLEEALELARDQGENEAFIIGGGQIYDYAIKKSLVDKMYLTYLDMDYDGDVYFPDFEMNNWKEAWRESHEKDENHEADFDFVLFEKNSKA